MPTARQARTLNASEISDKRVLRRYMCELATGEEGREDYTHVCAACESPCAYGLRYMVLLEMDRQAHQKRVDMRRALWVETACAPLKYRLGRHGV